jgi:HK97 family phage prohead protease
MGKHEIRSLTDEQPTVDGNTITGYAAVYNTFSQDLGGFREIIRPGAFDRCLASGPDVRALVDHDSSKILGRTKSGTCKLVSDARGLKYTITLPDTQTARDLKASMARGDIDGSSFAFAVVKNGDMWRKEGTETIRELHDADIFDVSVVTYPAYLAAESSLRSFNEFNEANQLEARKLEEQAKAEQAKEDEAIMFMIRAKQKQMEVEISL